MPPGDRLEATVLLYPGTDRVDLELEAEADKRAGSTDDFRGRHRGGRWRRAGCAAGFPRRFSLRASPIAVRTAGSD